MTAKNRPTLVIERPVEPEMTRLDYFVHWFFELIWAVTFAALIATPFVIYFWRM